MVVVPVIGIIGVVLTGIAYLLLQTHMSDGMSAKQKRNSMLMGLGASLELIIAGVILRPAAQDRCRELFFADRTHYAFEQARCETLVFCSDGLTGPECRDGSR